ncbi:MAG: multiheme c-type cytochrome [Planctomycetota bacterium]
MTSPADMDVSKGHSEYDKTRISAIVSPRDCSRCHPSEAAEYSRSKHANTLEIIWKIDPWLNHGMNNDIERATGCYHCHGSVVKIKDGEFDKHTWPNVGVGRVNPDGSKGSCSSCHTRHKLWCDLSCRGR